MAYNKSKTKGSAYERKIAIDFSQWWSNDTTSIFRNAGSGNRHVHNVYSGDLAPARDDIRWPLSVEVKKAENWSFDGFLKGNPSEPLLAYMIQTLGCAEMGCNRFPLLVCTKNYFKPYVFISWHTRDPLYIQKTAIKHYTTYLCRLRWCAVIPPSLVKRYHYIGDVDFICMHLDTFFQSFHPEDFV